MATITEQQLDKTSLPVEKHSAEDPSRPKRKPRSAAAKGWAASMRLVRRIHLYSGLFMFPWVLLYGVTGMFFNHPRWFTGGEVQPIATQTMTNSDMAPLPTADQMAAQVVTAINSQLTDSAAEGEATPRVVLTPQRPAYYNNFFTFTVRGDEVEHTITMNPETGKGEVRTKPHASEPPGPEELGPLAEVRQVEVEQNAMSVAQAALPQMLQQMGLPEGEVSAGRRSPNLTFSAEVDGQPVVLAYNMGNGAVATTPEGAPSSMDTKSFMQRLHLSRGYSPHWNVDWIWALLVDGMFLSMVFWGLSGLFMWWQIKRTRWLGGGFLLASLAVTVLLVASMHDNLSVASTRGRGQGGRGGGHNHGPAAESSSQEGSPREGNRGRGGRGRGGNRGGPGGNRARGENRGSEQPNEELSPEEQRTQQELREFESMLEGF